MKLLNCLVWLEKKVKAIASKPNYLVLIDCIYIQNSITLQKKLNSFKFIQIELSWFT